MPMGYGKSQRLHLEDVYSTGVHIFTLLILLFQIGNVCWQFPVEIKKEKNDLRNIIE
jgi:hypothetical protein